MKKLLLIAPLFAILLFSVITVSATAGLYQKVDLVNSANAIKGYANAESYMAVRWVTDELYGYTYKEYFWKDVITSKAIGLTPSTNYKLISVIGTKPAKCLATAKSDSTGVVNFRAEGEKLFNENPQLLNQKLMVVKSANVNCATGVYSNAILKATTKI